jgi:PTS system N-acetylgalactosamine-specific IIA component
MTKVIILGHGEYGTLIKSNLNMLVGSIEGFYYIDFKSSDNVDILRSKIYNLIKALNNSKILFICDVVGGTPFRESCLLAAENSDYVVVGGLNTAGISEIAYNLTMNPKELAELAIEAAKASMLIYNQE